PRLRYLPQTVRAQWLEEANGMPAEDVAAWRTIFPAALRLVGEMRRAGVRLIAGTDAGSTYDLPGSDLHNELGLLVLAGLSPLEALTAATHNAAQAVGWEDRSGTVAVGKLADLVLLEANPLADMANTRRIAAVVTRGRLLDAAELERMRRGFKTR